MGCICGKSHAWTVLKGAPDTYVGMAKSTILEQELNCYKELMIMGGVLANSRILSEV